MLQLFLIAAFMSERSMVRIEYEFAYRHLRLDCLLCVCDSNGSRDIEPGFRMSNKPKHTLSKAAMGLQRTFVSGVYAHRGVYSLPKVTICSGAWCH